MIGKLYNAKYIEEHFPWSVQKYEDQYGEPATSIFGILVNEFTKKFVFGNYHIIGGPINGNPMSPYKGCYVMKTTFSQFKDIIVPAVFFIPKLFIILLSLLQPLVLIILSSLLQPI
jgi:hypothetical protein